MTLLSETERIGRDQTARLLCVSREYVDSWFPRVRWNDGKTEPGLDPSGGFTAAALAVLRNGAAQNQPGRI